MPSQDVTLYSAEQHEVELLRWFVALKSRCHATMHHSYGVDGWYVQAEALAQHAAHRIGGCWIHA
eukprot:365048-Chlamydomonas_euryale.AAC.13